MSSRWHILGTGAMGCLMAAQLQRSGVAVTLLPRRAPADAGPLTLALGGLGADRQYTLPWEPIEADAPIRHLLVLTKAYDVEAAIAAVAHRLDATSLVLLMSNGMGFAERVAGRWPGLPLALGTTTEGAWRSASTGPAAWQVVHAGRGSTRIGQPGVSGPPPWFDDWQDALADCRWDPAIEHALWRKLAINCAINPLTALHGCANGELARDPALATQVRALCAEITAVCSAAGREGAVADLEATVFGVIAGTAANRSSMLQDVGAGRPTEIDYITGYLLGVARRCGVEAPLNASLLARVRRREGIPQAPGASR